MEQNSYSWLRAAKQTLIDLILRQIAINEHVSYDKEKTLELKALIDRLNEDDFKVLVMGIFSSGKSTLINALLGEAILPAKMLPATATICEIKYAEKKRCTLYPKGTFIDPVSGLERTEPFEIDLSKIKEYVLIDHTDRNDDEAGEHPEKKLSPFKKMVLEWPLGICKDGVQLTDSPGLNDPESHDTVTTDYLPETDAIIYCMSCLQAFQDTDKESIKMLRDLGYTNIIFVLTHFDQLQDTDEEAEFVAKMKHVLKPLTDLKEEGIVFLDSLGALRGKIKKDETKIAKSNVSFAERKIEKHLVGQRGKAKLIKAVVQTDRQNIHVGQSIENQLRLTSMDMEKLIKFHQEKKEVLEHARTQSELMLKTLELGINEIVKDSEDLAKVFFSSLREKIDRWVKDYKPIASLSLNVKAYAKKVVAEITYDIQKRMRDESICWAKESLDPMIREAILKISSSTEELQRSYEEAMADFDITDGLNIPSENNEATALAKFGSILYGFVTGDILGAGLGMAFGFKGLLTSLVSQIAAGVAIGVIGLFTPVGFVGFIVGAIIAAIAAFFWNHNLVLENIKRRVFAKISESFQDMGTRDKMISDISKKVRAELWKIYEEAEKNFKNDIDPKEKALDEALRVKQKGQKEVDEANVIWQREAKNNTAVSQELRNLKETVLL